MGSQRQALVQGTRHQPGRMNSFIE
uniref:Uncharacterized protein n=1 Tax=Arundo donax TaxID=35708 RepID=A0A0A9QKJ9_ARUDO